MRTKTYKRNALHIFAILFLLGIWCVSHLDAAVITVSTTEDMVSGSLRAAIVTANSNSEDDTIILPAGTYILTGTAGEDANAGGDLDIDNGNAITITGADRDTTIIDANFIDRVFHIAQGTLTITGVTLRNGKTQDADQYGEDAESGGAVYNSGTLHMRDCDVLDNATGRGGECQGLSDNAGNGGHGGAFYNNSSGTLNLKDMVIKNNVTGDGRASMFGVGGCVYGDGGSGGAVYNAGSLTLDDVVISDNLTGTSENDGSDGCITGNSGDGGAVYNSGSLTMTGCTINNNATGQLDSWGCSYYGPRSGHGGGICNIGGTVIIDNTHIIDNHTGNNDYFSGHGGGIYNDNGINISDCRISGNFTGNSNYGETCGEGGGIYNSGTFSLVSSTIDNNATGYITHSGNGGNGGGIFNSSVFLLANSTVSTNKTGYGLGEGSDGNGGGIYNTGTMEIISVTIYLNTTDTTGEDDNGSATSGNGGGIYNHGGTIDIGSTILAGNTVPQDAQGPDCYGNLVSYGYNLLENNNGCTYGGTLTGNITGLNPSLESLQYNGGAAPTHALKTDSPALDAGSSFGYDNDQRGENRIVDIDSLRNALDGADIGAFELETFQTEPPFMQVQPTQFTFGADTAGHYSSPQTLNVINTGGGTLQWSASSNAHWLNCDPQNGTGDGVVTLSLDSTAFQQQVGTYTATVTLQDSQAENSPQYVTVTLKLRQAGTLSPPMGLMDTPVSGSAVAGSVAVTGWAIDDIGVLSVKIYRRPVESERGDAIYIGDAVFVEGARPDVMENFPEYPGNYRAGWGYMLLTNLLPGQGNGTYTLFAVATDYEGNTVTLGTSTIFSDNLNAVKPFGAIDTPSQGGTAIGDNYINFGWALTPQPNTIPTDGSTITVWVDGMPLDNVTYDNYRNDIATLFPDYVNSNGAVGYYSLDTTAYQNAVHTIAWSVRDDAGNSDGIGSRYFNILNIGTQERNTIASTMQTAQQTKSTPAKKSIHRNVSQILPDPVSPLYVGTGFDIPTQETIILPDHKGVVHLSIQPDKPLSIRFFKPGEGKTLQYYPAALPVGASLDSENGIFRWLPGIAFAGRHPVVFLVLYPDGSVTKRLVDISVQRETKVLHNR